MLLAWLSVLSFAQDPCPLGDVCVPANYWSASCDNVCAQFAGTIVCDLDLGSSAYDYLVAITDFDGNATTTYSIFGGTEQGGSTGTNFACYFDNSPPVDIIEIGGSGGDDLIQLEYVNKYWQLYGPQWTTVWGEAGQDTLRGTDSTMIDFLHGGKGSDTLLDGRWMYGDESLDTITCSAVGACTVEGGDDDDTIDCADNTACQAQGNHGDDVLTGSDHADVLRGGVGYDEIDGGDGDDTIKGGPNADVLNGGDGEDTIHGDGGGDTIDGGNYTDHLYGGDATDHIYGGGGDDFIYGEGGDDVLRGGPGSDFMSGGVGEDRMNSGTGDDEMQGGPEADRLCDAMDLFEPDSIVDGGGGDDSGWVYYVAGATVTFTSVEVCGHVNYDPACTLLFEPSCLSEFP